MSSSRAQVGSPTPHPAGHPLAVFDEAYRTLLSAYAALEAENADLRSRLALLEPTMEEPSSEAPAEKGTKEGKKDESGSSVAAAAAGGGGGGGGGGKFRAVKDFLFKSKPKTEEEKAKERARSSGKAGEPPPELWAGDPRRRTSLLKKLDRWVLLRAMEGGGGSGSGSGGGGVVDVGLGPPDAGLIASAARDGVARLWSVEPTAPGAVAVCVGHKGSVNSVRFQPNSGRLVCTAGADGTCLLFRIPNFLTHAPQRSPKAGEHPSLFLPESPGQTPEGSDIETPPHTPRAPPLLTAPPVVVDPVVSLSVAGTFREHAGEVMAADWLPSGDAIASVSRDSTLKVWDASSLQASTVAVLFPASDNNPHLSGVSTHPSQPIVLGPGSDGLCRVWDVRDLKLCDLISHSGERAAVSHALFSHDGGLIITGGDDRLIKLWDSRNTGQPLDAIRCGSVQTKFSLSRRTNSLAIPMRDSKLKISDTQGYNVGACETQRHHKEALSCCVWSEDETLIYVSSLDDKNSLSVWRRDSKDKE